MKPRLTPMPPPAEATADPSLTLSKADMAGHLRCSERQIDNLRPELPEPLYIGTSPRWMRSAIVEWLASRQGNEKCPAPGRRVQGNRAFNSSAGLFVTSETPAQQERTNDTSKKR